ncbi:unnamed protein product, partial [Timema podura]|nr:unnamed protein product [Timema podura]
MSFSSIQYDYPTAVHHRLLRVITRASRQRPPAVTQVNERFQFNRRVQPIAMYPHLDVPDGSIVTVVGWGRTEPYVEGMTKVLMKVETEVWPLDECKKFWKELRFKFEI